MKINQNNDITIYRGETGAIDFKISQRSDYYVPFLISDNRVNPMVCITIGSTRRESKNIVNKQLWLDLPIEIYPRFNQTVVTDLATITVTPPATLAEVLNPLMEPGVMYQFRLTSEVNAGINNLHFAYEIEVDNVEVQHIDDYDFKVIMALDENITLDMTNVDYFYQIELMNTEPMIPHIQSIFNSNPSLINKLPAGFTNDELGITNYKKACIDLISKTYPNHWGYRITDPYTSPVASVSNIQMLQPPRSFTVQSVVK
jgi:hypothetical protein